MVLPDERHEFDELRLVVAGSAPFPQRIIDVAAIVECVDELDQERLLRTPARMPVAPAPAAVASSCSALRPTRSP